MKEAISRVEILNTGELVVALASGGKSGYYLIYREAAEVTWENSLKAFKSLSPRSWSYPDWFRHIVKNAKDCSIHLTLSNETVWVNVPEGLRQEVSKDQG